MLKRNYLDNDSKVRVKILKSYIPYNFYRLLKEFSLGRRKSFGPFE
jgi:hypothetical protein